MKRKPLLWTAGVVVAVAASAGTVFVVRDPQSPVSVAAVRTTGTVRVVRADLATTMPMFGTLGFAGAVTVTGGTAGHGYTWLPVPGAVIEQGAALYEVDGRRVPLLRGDRPAWRALAADTEPGPDIAQLNTALVQLGYATGLAGDPHFRAATAAAVRRWQHALGVPVTGRVELGQVVFGPAPLRVREVAAKLGGPAEPGAELLTATSTERVVTLPVPVDRAYLLHVSDAVTITLPDARTTTAGTVSAVSPVAAAPESQDGRPGVSTMDVSVMLADPSKVAAYTTAPVSVSVTTQQVKGVLAVPVTALLARPEGGFAVTLLEGGQRRQVPVQTGMFANTLVEVSGAGLAEGSTVEVP